MAVFLPGGNSVIKLLFHQASAASHKLPFFFFFLNLMIGLLLPSGCCMFPEIPSPKSGHKGMGEMFCE